MIYVVTDFRGSYHHVVDKLRGTGAELIELDPTRGLDRTISKAGILRQVSTPRLARLWRRWTSDDVVLVISWYLIPMLALMRLRLLRRPRRLLSLGTFVHDERLRRIVNLVLRRLKTDELEFVAFSDAERRNLVEVVGMPATNVHRVMYRGGIREPVEAPVSEGDYVFTGGYSNRDYDTFFAAVQPLPRKIVTVASALNGLGKPPPNVELRLDVSWDEFEELVGGCALLVLPLKEGGEACGQNVLWRGIRHRRPLIATRHDSLIGYLGDDYPGFVSPGDPGMLQALMERALADEPFRGRLVERVEAVAHRFREQEHVEAEIVGILER